MSKYKLTILFAFIGLSVGLGMVIEYNTDPLISWGFVLRTLGLVFIVFSLTHIIKVEL